MIYANVNHIEYSGNHAHDIIMFGDISPDITDGIEYVGNILEISYWKDNGGVLIDSGSGDCTARIDDSAYETPEVQYDVCMYFLARNGFIPVSENFFYKP